jgi:hypothetical protein
MEWYISHYWLQNRLRSYNNENHPQSDSFNIKHTNYYKSILTFGFANAPNNFASVHEVLSSISTTACFYAELEGII